MLVRPIIDPESIEKLLNDLESYIVKDDEAGFFSCIEAFTQRSGIKFCDVVNTPTQQRPLLHTAIYYGRSSIVNRLIDDFKANVNSLDNYNSTSPLSLAFIASKGAFSTSRNRLAIIDKLLASGADIHLKHEKAFEYDDATPYNIALRGAIICGIDAVNFLLNRDNSLNRAGMLKYAVDFSDDPLLVKLFIQENNDQYELDDALKSIFNRLIHSSGMTRIGTGDYPASLEKKAGVVELLLKSGANPNLSIHYKTTDGPIRSLLWIALANRSKNTFLALQLAGAKDVNMYNGRGLGVIHSEMKYQLTNEIQLRRNAQLIALGSLDKYNAKNPSGVFSLLPHDLLIRVAALTADEKIIPLDVATAVTARAIKSVRSIDAAQRPQWQLADETQDHVALKDYKNAAALRPDDDYKKSITLFGRTFTGWGKSGKQKKDASKALYDVVYYGKALETLEEHLPSLRNGELGRIYRKLGFK